MCNNSYSFILSITRLIMQKLIKIFLIWLLLQFFAFNWVSFGIWFENQIIWLWKEFMVILFLWILIWQMFKNKRTDMLFKDKGVFYLQIMFVALVVVTFVINYFFKNIPIWQFVLAFKYDFIGFMIFFIFYNSSFFQDKDFLKNILWFYWKTIKWILVLSLIWYCVIIFKPWTLKLFWYDRNINEWSLWIRPPAVYYTRWTDWLVRNQFLFERPITFWFFLTAFWPLFYMLYLRRKSMKKTRWWWFLYGLNVVLTFSRAAWWAWFFEIILIWWVVYRKNIKKYFMRVIMPLVLIMWLLVIVWYRHIVSREFSNTGHKVLLEKWFHMFAQSPLTWKWAAYAGPWSHQVCEDPSKDLVCQEIVKINTDMESKLKGFNTENQFLQVLVEFWLIWFILWFGIYCYLNFYWVYMFFKSWRTKQEDEHLLYLIAFSIWMLGLSIEWLVLHSFVDRMVVYPMMLLFGLVLGNYILRK